MNTFINFSVISKCYFIKSSQHVQKLFTIAWKIYGDDVKLFPCGLNWEKIFHMSWMKIASSGSDVNFKRNLYAEYHNIINHMGATWTSSMKCKIIFEDISMNSIVKLNWHEKNIKFFFYDTDAHFIFKSWISS